MVPGCQKREKREKRMSQQFRQADWQRGGQYCRERVAISYEIVALVRWAERTQKWRPQYPKGGQAAELCRRLSCNLVVLGSSQCTG